MKNKASIEAAEAKAEEIYLFFDQFPNMNKSDVKAASLFVVNQMIQEHSIMNELFGICSLQLWELVKELIEKS